MIDRLFRIGDKSVSCFPLRVVYLQLPRTELAGVQLLISVPKRHFKRAVKRNRVKRQLREMFRHVKPELEQYLDSINSGLLLAFLYSDDNLWTSERLNVKFDEAMQKLYRKLGSVPGQNSDRK